MNLKTYFSKKKTEMFPNITDWDSEETAEWINSIKNTYDVSKLNYKTWFWFHPTALSLISYSITILALIMFGGCAAYMAYRKIWILFGLAGFIVVKQIFALINKIRQRKVYKDMTFYDLWMKE